MQSPCNALTIVARAHSQPRFLTLLRDRASAASLARPGQRDFDHIMADSVSFNGYLRCSTLSIRQFPRFAGAANCFIADNTANRQLSCWGALHEPGTRRFIESTSRNRRCITVRSLRAAHRAPAPHLLLLRC